MIITTYISTEDLINKLQSLKGKTKLKFFRSISDYYDEMNIRRQSGTFQFEGDPFSKGVQGIGKIYHEVLLLRKFLLTKPSVENGNINYYDLYYTVIKNRDDDKDVVDKHEDFEKDYFNFTNFITPNHSIGRKNNQKILR